jgi:predicted dehydrogenase
VLLEAFHTRFHPAWYAFLSSIDSAAVQNVQSSFSIYRGFFPLKNQIRYEYELAGGSLLDIGTYGVTAIREAFGTEPVKCLDGKARMHLDSQTIDEGLKATFRFPNGGIGSIDGDLARQGWMGLPKFEMSKISVEQREVRSRGVRKLGMERCITRLEE